MKQVEFEYHCVKCKVTKWYNKEKHELGMTKCLIVLRMLPSVNFHFKLTFLYSPSDRPEAPYNLSVISYTWESVYIGWTPGFNGGETQSFFIHFTSSVPPIYTGEITVSPPAATRFNITGKTGWFCIFQAKQCFSFCIYCHICFCTKKKEKGHGIW